MYYSFVDLENIGVDTKILILCQLELEILFKLDFNGGPFEKWPKAILRPNFFSGNITHIIPRSSHFRVFLGILGFFNMTVYLYVLPSVIQPWHMPSLISATTRPPPPTWRLNSGPLSVLVCFTFSDPAVAHDVFD